MATIMVLAFMVLAVPLITSALALTSSLSVDSRIKAGILRSQYAVLGGTQYAAYRLAYESGYAESLSSSVPDVFTVSLMGDDVTVSVLKVTEVAGDPPPPSWDSSRRLRASKVDSFVKTLAKLGQGRDNVGKRRGAAPGRGR